jgi:dienelactone hydrolase
MSVALARTIILLLFAQVAPLETGTPAEVKRAFLALLDRPRVALDVKREAPDLASDGLVTEHWSFASEKLVDGSMERVPVLVIRPKAGAGKRPAVIALHGTGGHKDGMRSWLIELAKLGIIGVAIDGRYHGDRTVAATARGAKRTQSGLYVDAITRAWRTKAGQPQEHPLYYDTCWDVWRTVDYLVSRDDVDPKRIGVLGISKGGIETWLAGAVDDRIAVAIPAISVQSFRWSLENEQWHGRARTVAGAHDAASHDLGELKVNARVCRELWNKVMPGILGPFDCPSMIRLFAGRPLLILNGETDPNCPIAGANVAFAAAQAAYKEANASDRLRIMVARGVGHAITKEQHDAAIAWFVRWLEPGDTGR